jgi:hypothetical protein
MLKAIDGLKRDLSRVENSKLDSAARLSAARDAVLSALIIASEFHKWTVVDNEAAIDARIRCLDGAKRGLAKKARDTKLRDMKLAREYEARRSRPGCLSDSALMQVVGKSVGLRRSASIAAIKRGLQLLK